jgi:hypothetical protein
MESRRDDFVTIVLRMCDRLSPKTNLLLSETYRSERMKPLCFKKFRPRFDSNPESSLPLPPLWHETCFIQMHEQTSTTPMHSRHPRVAECACRSARGENPAIARAQTQPPLGTKSALKPDRDCARRLRLHLCGITRVLETPVVFLQLITTNGPGREVQQ